MTIEAATLQQVYLQVRAAALLHPDSTSLLPSDLVCSQKLAYYVSIMPT